VSEVVADHLIAWCDSCSGQNKNFSLIALWQYLVLTGKFKVIDQKFPEVGHTMLDSDRDFARIENELRRHQNIYSPHEYRDFIRDCQNKNKFVVTKMDGAMKNLKALPGLLGLTQKTTDDSGKKVPFKNGVKWIRVDTFGQYKYKKSHDEAAPFQTVTILKKHAHLPTAPLEVPSKSDPHPISAEKKTDIEKQLPYVPSVYQNFYKGLLE
jgi:hypothetical protein